MSLVNFNYLPQLPFNEKKWRQIADDFNLQKGLPNCVGVIGQQPLVLADPAKPTIGSVVMLIHATGRISYSQLINHGPKSSMEQPVYDFLKNNVFRVPQPQEGQQLLFIGSEYHRKEPLLATPHYPGHFKQAQLQRGKELERKLNQVLMDRFDILGPKPGKPNPKGLTYQVLELALKDGALSPARVRGAVLVLGKMHNFLMDKSATYGDAFKRQSQR